MTTFKVFKPAEADAESAIVESVYGREKDLYHHKETLERYRTILKDENFVGRVFADGTTFRQKIENEIPILEGAIKECEKLIEVAESSLPSPERIKEVLVKIEALQ